MTDWIAKVVKERGVTEIGVHSVLRLWSEGELEEAVEHLHVTDSAGNRKCSECGQLLSKGKQNV